MADAPREINRSVLGEGRHLSLEEVLWEDGSGRQRSWETAERTGGVRAVSIIPWMVPSNRLVFVRQFRPPARGVVIEFPAGLIDGSETVEETALRELKEETGFTGRIVLVSPASLSSPGMTGESAFTCVVEIDENDPSNHRPEQATEEGEDIEVFLVEREDVGTWLREQMAQGAKIAARMTHYLIGLGVWGEHVGRDAP